MATLLLLVVSIVTITLQTVRVASQTDSSNLPYMYEAKVINGDNGTCPTAEDRETVRNVIHQEVQVLLQSITSDTRTTTETCGGTDGWARIAYLNASDSSQQCPPGLTESTYSGIRLCGRAPGAPQYSCASTIFQGDGRQYREVCGRVVGYQYGAPLAFGKYTDRGAVATIDEYYVDGVTVTHGPVGAREHIWTFANGHNENIPSNLDQYACPCAPGASGIIIPPFIGENYFCESGAPTNSVANSEFPHIDPLWDGDGCA